MNGIQEVSGSIPLISTKGVQKVPYSVEYGTFCLFFLLQKSRYTASYNIATT
nr:MAG TPA: hypothetical protein [Caudoviricetes sp.]